MSKLQKSQLTNLVTNLLYLRQMLSLAENVFKFENLPEFIDVAYMNKCLLNRGAIAFFYEETLDTIVALPFEKYGSLDLYGRYNTKQVIGSNGYTRVLNKDEFVIMYDNYGKYPLYLDIIQYAKRMALYERICDVNIAQQRTPRIWQTSTDMERTVKDLLNNIDGLTESVTSYQNLQLDKINAILQPAPYVADKITERKEKLWNEFLRLIGIANITVQKKERNIRDEIMASQGGTIASRFQRYEPRKKAIEEINTKFKKYLKAPIVVSFYDNLPTNLKDIENEIEDDTLDESEVSENVIQ